MKLVLLTILTVLCDAPCSDVLQPDDRVVIGEFDNAPDTVSIPRDWLGTIRQIKTDMMHEDATPYVIDKLPLSCHQSKKVQRIFFCDYRDTEQ